MFKLKYDLHIHMMIQKLNEILYLLPHYSKGAIDSPFFDLFE